MTSKFVTVQMRPFENLKTGCRVPERRYEGDKEHLLDQLLNAYIIDARGCWLWRGLTFSNGYPRFSEYREVGMDHRVHRASYEFYKGDIPEGLLCLHDCDIKQCINPDHLHLGTHADNMREAAERGLMKRFWTQEMRAAKSVAYTGEGNPMYGKAGRNRYTCKK